MCRSRQETLTRSCCRTQRDEKPAPTNRVKERMQQQQPEKDHDQYPGCGEHNGMAVLV